MFGPPGAGKGTQAQIIAKKYNLFQLSTGDLLREEIKKKTSLSKEIEKIISKGNFADDNIVNKLLKKTISLAKNKNRIIFDGYPRNISQAKNLEIILKQDNQIIGLIVFLNVKRDIVKKRIMGRIICEKCNIVLNEFFNLDDINNHSCGKNFLKKRKDDNVDVIMNRYDTYMKITQPVLDFYRNTSNFNEIDGSLKIDEISTKIEQLLAV